MKLLFLIGFHLGGMIRDASSWPHVYRNLDLCTVYESSQQFSGVEGRGCAREFTEQ